MSFIKKYYKTLLATFGMLALVLSSSPNALAEDKEDLLGVTLNICVYPIGSPQVILKDDITKPSGIDIDIIYELKDRLGFNLVENRIFPIDIQMAFDRLKKKQIDLFAGGISYTEERTKFYDYSPIIQFSSQGIMYNKERMPGKIGFNDFKGKKVGYQEGSIALNFVKEMGAEAVAIHNPTLAYFAVSSGSLDGFVFDRPPLVAFANELPTLNLAVSEDRFGEELTQYAFLMPKDSPYRKVISDTIEEMYMDGTIEAILKKWNAL